MGYTECSVIVALIVGLTIQEAAQCGGMRPRHIHYPIGVVGTACPVELLASTGREGRRRWSLGAKPCAW